MTSAACHGDSVEKKKVPSDLSHLSQLQRGEEMGKGNELMGGER